jgi:hypothetical protein
MKVYGSVFGGLGAVFMITQTVKEYAVLSKAGSAEEAAALKKTEVMAHVAALGSANGASDALKSRWWSWGVVKKEGSAGNAGGSKE